MKNDEEFFVSKEWQNNIEYKPWIFDFFEDFLLCCILYPAVALLLESVLRNDFAYFRALLILPIFMVATVCRRMARNIIVLILLLLLMITAIFFVPSPFSGRFILAGIALSASFYTISKFKNDILSKAVNFDFDSRVMYNLFLARYVPSLGIAFLYIVYMVALGFQKSVIITLCFFSFVIFLITYKIYAHTSGTCALKKWESMKQDASSKNFTVFFSALLAAGLGIVSFIVYKIVYLTGLNRIDYRILDYLLHGRKINDSLNTEIVKSTPSIPKPSGNNINIKIPEVSAAQKNMGIALSVVVWIVIAIVAIFILAILLKWVFGFIRRMQNNTYEETQSIFSLSETKDKLAHKFRMLPGIRKIIGGSSYSVKIRRLYFKTIVKFSDAGADIKGCDAPYEISEKVKNRAEGDIFAATDLYEKARYAEDECTPEDLKAAKLYLDGKKGQQ